MAAPAAQTATRSQLTADAPLRGRVVLIGSINVDLVIYARHLPAPGETVLGGTFTRHHGGKGANQAVAAARLGAAVTFVGAVGADEMGDESRVELEAEGIDTDRIAPLPDTPTGVALIVVDERGENQIAVASGANARVDGNLVEAALSSYEFMPGGVLLAGFEVSDEAVLAGARQARAHGMRIVINPAPARPLLDELVALGPILLANRLEAQALSGESEPEAAARELSARTGAPVVVTLGADGALVVAGSDVTHLPAPPARVVDTTGAGDTFAGALAAELTLGRPLTEATRLAVRAASMSVTAAGARGGMPTRAQLDAAG